MEKYLYNDFSRFLAKFFDGKIQKIAVNAGFSCPNRDGSIGRGGCAYCNNHTFNPDYCATEISVCQQLQEGKDFFSSKYPEMRYLAYFQAYTNTYADLDDLKRLYEEALQVDGVVGLVIGTRPDCMPDTLLNYLSDLHRQSFVLLEYGVESTDNHTLERVNRGHTYECAVDTVRRTSSRGIPVGIHLIMGLPGETRQQMVERATVISDLPIDTVKLHQLQLVRGTRFAMEYAVDPGRFDLFQPGDYVLLVADFLERLRPDITVERFTSQSPKNLLIAPDWGMKNFEFVELVKRELRRRGTCQGTCYRGKTIL